MGEGLTPARARVIARAAASRLAAMVGPDGRFLYRYALNDPSFVSVTYSDTRHAGAVWAMADAAREGWAIPGYEEALARAATHLEERIFRPFGATGALCVLDEGFIKLSGSALGIAAEVALLRQSDDGDRRDRIERLARHVASQREADGDFLPARVPGPIARAHPARDDLTPGQAIMALALAGEATGQTALAALALESADAFARRDFLVGRLAHWMLYAIEALDRIAPDDARLAYAGRLADGLGRIAVPHESVPLACVSEGLLAYGRTLRARRNREKEVATLLLRVEGNLRRQLRFFHPSGAFVMSASRPEVRIDTIMHSMLGFLGWARLASG